MNQEREIGYCESCGRLVPWLTVVALHGKCLCGSEQVSRGETGVRYQIRERDNVDGE